MKKYRCPYCGEECITLFYDISCSRRSYNHNYGSINDGKYATGSCNNCCKLFMTRPHHSNKIIYTICNVGIIMLSVLLVLDFIFILTSRLTVNETIAMILIVLTFAAFILCLIGGLIFTIYRWIDGVALVRYPGEEPFYESQNARVMLTGPCVKIKNLGIYGLKFDIRVRERRFLETFKNEFVPAVFYREGRNLNRGPINVELMKRDFIPKEFLRVGSSFAVWDNGKVIGHGMITEILEKKVPLAKEKTRLRILYEKIFLEKK